MATTAAALPVSSARMVQQPELEGLRMELLAGRWMATSIFGNLNGVARHANSTGELKPGVEALMTYIRKLARRMDRIVEDIRVLTR